MMTDSIAITCACVWGITGCQLGCVGTAKPADGLQALAVCMRPGVAMNQSLRRWCEHQHMCHMCHACRCFMAGAVPDLASGAVGSAHHLWVGRQAFGWLLWVAWQTGLLYDDNETKVGVA